jgi:hypothetical protein
MLDTFQLFNRDGRADPDALRQLAERVYRLEQTLAMGGGATVQTGAGTVFLPPSASPAAKGVGCLVSASSGVSVNNNNNFTIANWDTLSFDDLAGTANAFYNSSVKNQLAVAQPGLYLAGATLQVSTVSSGTLANVIGVEVATASTNQVLGFQFSPPWVVAAVATNFISTSGLVRISAADTLYVNFYQSAGSTVTVLGNSFWVAYLGS